MMNLLLNIGLTIGLTFGLAQPHVHWFSVFDPFLVPYYGIKGIAIIASCMVGCSSILIVLSRFKRIRQCFLVGFFICYSISFFVVSYHATALLYISSVCLLRWSRLDRLLWSDDYPGATSVGKLDEPNEALTPIRSTLLQKKKKRHRKKKPNELFLGLSMLNRKPVVLSTAAMNMHTHVVGASGSGKTNLLKHVVEFIATNRYSCVFIDGKSGDDLEKSIQSICNAHSHQHIIFSTDNISESVSYNPFFEGKDGNELKDKLLSLIPFSEPYYERIATQYFGILMCALKNKGDTFTIQTIIEIMQNETKFFELLNHPNNHAYKATAHMGLQSLNKKQLEDAKSIAMDLFDLINSPFGNKLIKQPSELNLFDALSNNTSFVYCGVNANRLGKSAEMMGRVILADIKTLVSKIEQAVPVEKRQPIFVVVDEFSNFLNNEFLKVIEMGRSAGIHIIISHQNIEQLNTFSPEFKDTIIANTNNKIVFSQRSASAQDWAEMFGTKTKKYYTQSEDSEGMGVQGYNARLGEAFIVHPNKIKELPIGQCYFLSKEKNTIIRDRVHVPIFSD
jgi:type IV secretory pathway TraG/TraD family ATPase VirD4